MSLLLVDATDLAAWANRREAQSRLPELIRRLVLATTGDVTHLAFRSGEGVQLTGWDGTVSSPGGSTFVPAGASGWEGGCNQDRKGKADDDFETRKNDPLGLDAAQTTFVFVTPRRWDGKADWIQQRQAENAWKDVRAYDADDLVTWLSAAPAVHIWFSIIIGKHPREAEALETFADRWRDVTRPAVSGKLLVTGRGNAVKEVQHILAGPPAAIAVQADTRDEAVAFVDAAIGLLQQAECDRNMVRSVVVHDEATWRHLERSQQPLILIPTFEDRSRVAAAVAHGHHVVIPLARNEPSLGNTLELLRPRRAEVEPILVEMGIEKEHARELAPLARATLGALRRALARAPSSLVPQWATEHGRDVLPALLAGRWNEQSEADCKIVAGLAGRTYDEYRLILSRLAAEPDPPVRRIGTTWTISAKDDAWAMLARIVRDEDLTRLEAAVLEACGEIDPRYELPANNRWAAALHGKVLRHSTLLREALTDTLTVIAANSVEIPLGTTRSAQEWVDHIVRRVLEAATTDQHWASLGSQLRALAEAAPDVFLDIFDARFGDASSLVDGLFIVDGDALFVRSPHTEVLWALEVLAWSPEHFGRAVRALARLARRDPGGKTANRPARSLREIFLPWHPSTSANVGSRIRVLDSIRQKQPDVAWELLCELLPTPMGTAMSSAQPRRRDWVPTRNGVSIADYTAMTRAVLERVREDVGTSGARWKRLITGLNDLPDNEFDKVLDVLGAVDVASLPNADRMTIWASLRDFIARQREFADAKWSMPAERLARLDELYDRLEPVDALDKIAWLFDGSPHPPKAVEKDWREREKVVDRMRISAIEEICRDAIHKVFELARRVAFPQALGFALGRAKVAAAAEPSVFDLALGAQEDVLRVLARGFLYGRYSVEGEKWLKSIPQADDWSAWSALQKADYFSVLPFRTETWELLSLQTSEVEPLFWREVQILGRGELTEGDRDHVIRNLVRYGRVVGALEIATMYRKKSDRKPNAELLVEVLEAFAVSTTEDRAIDWGMAAYNVGELLEIVAASSEIAIERVARLEWLFLRLLKDQRPPTVLHRGLSEDPKLFVDVLALIYKGRNEPPREVTPEFTLRANLAYELLQEWKSPPGMTDGTFDLKKLRDWVDTARDLAAAGDRATMADQEIGRVLSFSGADKDAVWPSVPVRELVERVSSDALEDGMYVGVLNSRGVVTRGMGEGGVKERELAELYRRYASALADEWPRTARIAKRIADYYDGDARRVDVHAELEEELW